VSRISNYFLLMNVCVSIPVTKSNQDDVIKTAAKNVKECDRDPYDESLTKNIQSIYQGVNVSLQEKKASVLKTLKEIDEEINENEAKQLYQAKRLDASRTCRLLQRMLAFKYGMEKKIRNVDFAEHGGSMLTFYKDLLGVPVSFLLRFHFTFYDICIVNLT